MMSSRSETIVSRRSAISVGLGLGAQIDGAEPLALDLLAVELALDVGHFGHRRVGLVLGAGERLFRRAGQRSSRMRASISARRSCAGGQPLLGSGRAPRALPPVRRWPGGRPCRRWPDRSRPRRAGRRRLRRRSVAVSISSASAARRASISAGSSDSSPISSVHSSRRWRSVSSWRPAFSARSRHWPASLSIAASRRSRAAISRAKPSASARISAAAPRFVATTARSRSSSPSSTARSGTPASADSALGDCRRGCPGCRCRDGSARLRSVALRLASWAMARSAVASSSRASASAFCAWRQACAAFAFGLRQLLRRLARRRRLRRGAASTARRASLRLLLEFGQPVLLRQALGGGGRRIGAGDEAVPAPERAFAADQTLARRQQRLQFARPRAASTTPIWARRRASCAGARTTAASASTPSGNAGSPRQRPARPMRRRRRFERHIEVFAKRRAQRRLVAAFDRDLFEHRRKQVAAGCVEDPGERARLGLDARRASPRRPEGGARQFLLAAARGFSLAVGGERVGLGVGGALVEHGDAAARFLRIVADGDARGDFAELGLDALDIVGELAAAVEASSLRSAFESRPCAAASAGAVWSVRRQPGFALGKRARLPPRSRDASLALALVSAPAFSQFSSLPPSSRSRMPRVSRDHASPRGRCRHRAAAAALEFAAGGRGCGRLPPRSGPWRSTGAGRRRRRRPPPRAGPAAGGADRPARRRRGPAPQRGRRHSDGGRRQGALRVRLGVLAQPSADAAASPRPCGYRPTGS